jgi:hypothetical protein
VFVEPESYRIARNAQAQRRIHHGAGSPYAHLHVMGRPDGSVN